MEKLEVYFNELCLTDPHENHDQAWETSVGVWIVTIECLLTVKSDVCIRLPITGLTSNCGDQSLAIRIKSVLKDSKTRYQRLLTRLRPLSEIKSSLDHEVRFDGESTIGLTLADVAAGRWKNGWAMSLFLPNSPWLHSSVEAQRWQLTDDGILEGPTDCQIGHLSCIDHVNHWQTQIRDWGILVADSSILDEIDGHPIVMYSAPREHGLPHVHLLQSRACRTTLAKFRIDVFERFEGKPRWDIQMKAWIEQHRERLLCSWERCQRGGHPYQIK